MANSHHIDELEQIYQDTEVFRDRIATVDEDGKRIWVYPKKPSGRLYRARTILSFFLLAFLFGAPFIKINGEPLILLNILERKFIIFGLAFWPQDFHLFALAALTLAVFIILFTVVFGRVFCGWICPQTIFMEMVFRKIEYFIEGDAHKQRALNKAPWSPEKFLKKASKHIIFYAISFIIGNTFLAYIIGVDELYKIVTDHPSQHLGGLSAMIIFSFVFYGVFSWFREQACVIVCPYGRLQGVLLDANSIVVAYDFKRGEPRGRFRKNQPREGQGDCIACGLCEQVCPTGIDIKNGTQLECVNCTACIDACDSVMDRINKPRGLIRYASYNGIKEGVRLRLTPRIIGYSTILVLLVSALTFLLANRAPLEATILRTPGVLYQETPDGKIQNLYNIKVVNKTFDPKEITLQLKDRTGDLILVSGQALPVPKDGLAESAFFVRLPRSELTRANTIIYIDVLEGGNLVETIQTAFMGPAK
ncbi:MAG: cytochrome c oxidase accessory protein CcoG [Calditrichaeota bacterium]|nr:cytochrome c oxidase accessory protein CcoG [Calditrichota bacterium]MCB0291300.1 cytochrome c oxidase accessory protein CcoG [Calditrichota bacterium]MCB9088073.1 cytochrome c oxidase accessory protein CcoG [Calditrichia bacterium]